MHNKLLAIMLAIGSAFALRVAPAAAAPPTSAVAALVQPIQYYGRPGYYGGPGYYGRPGFYPRHRFYRPYGYRPYYHPYRHFYGRRRFYR